LRFAPTAWEIANRMDEFLFVGLAFVVAYAVADRLPSRRRLGASVAALVAAVIVVGDATTGWPVDSVLAAPTEIVASGHVIPSETLAVGRWVKLNLPAQGGFAAPQSDARTILLYGDGRVYTGSTADIDALLTTPSLPASALSRLRAQRIRYVVVDRRFRGNDLDLGFGFSVHGRGGAADVLLPSAVVTKFDDLPAPRLYDSGDVAVYDVGSAE
jgi:hypothetical protein